MWNKQRYCRHLQNHVWITNFCGENRKTSMLWKYSYFFVVQRYGKSCQEMCGTILWAGKQDDATTLHKYLLHALMTIISRKKNEICWRLVKKYALKLFWNVYTWHELEDLIFCGQWTNLHDRLRNGPKLVTNDHLVWSPTFITQVSTNNIVMWGTLQNSADWDCFKSPILQKILRIRNLLQMEHCVFQNTFVPICWMCKQQTSVSHSSTESKIISLDASLRVDGIFDRYCSWRKYEQSRYRVRSSPHTIHKRKQFQRVINDLESVDFFPQTSNLLAKKLCCTFLKIKKAVIKMIIQGRSPAKRHFSRTRRVAPDWLFDPMKQSIWTLKSKSNTFTPKTNLPTL